MHTPNNYNYNNHGVINTEPLHLNRAPHKCRSDLWINAYGKQADFYHNSITYEPNFMTEVSGPWYAQSK